jgi:hypothetical protein
MAPDSRRWPRATLLGGERLGAQRSAAQYTFVVRVVAIT